MNAELETIRSMGFSDENIREAMREIYPNGYATASRRLPGYKEDTITSLDEMIAEYPLWFLAISPQLLPSLFKKSCQSRVTRLLQTRTDESIKIALALTNPRNDFTMFNRPELSLKQLYESYPMQFAQCLATMDKQFAETGLF